MSSGDQTEEHIQRLRAELGEQVCVEFAQVMPSDVQLEQLGKTAQQARSGRASWLPGLPNRLALAISPGSRAKDRAPVGL